MTELSAAPYSYRDDPGVPAFDDSRPLFVFDGVCVLCSGGAARIMRADKRQSLAFTPAAGQLGAALYRHYGLDLDDTYLFLVDGRAYGMSEGYFRVAQALGGVWKAAKVFRIFPPRLRDWAYRQVAANRYRWFGKVEACSLLTPEQRAQMI